MAQRFLQLGQSLLEVHGKVIIVIPAFKGRKKRGYFMESVEWSAFWRTHSIFNIR